MILFLNVVLAVVFALSIVLFIAMSKVGKETVVSLPAAGVRNVGEEQVASAHAMWSRLAGVFIALVVAAFVLVNI